MSRLTTRRQILEALKDRVEGITRGGGYTTNAGHLVTLNEVYNLGANDSDPDVAVAMLVDPDEVKGWQGEYVRLRLPVRFIATARATLVEPWLAAEDVLGDLKEAIEATDRTLAGLVRQELQRGSTATMQKEPGSTFVGVILTYYADYVERWGNPDI
jgi:hypothetical protein